MEIIIKGNPNEIIEFVAEIQQYQKSYQNKEIITSDGDMPCGEKCKVFIC